MEKKATAIQFIDEGTYKALSGKHFSLEEIIAFLRSFGYYSNFSLDTLECDTQKFSKVSPMTKALIRNTNLAIENILFGLSTVTDLRSDNLNIADANYASDYIDNFLKVTDHERAYEYPGSEVCDSNTEDKKYYEIIPFNGDKQLTLVVVVKGGFITNLTESKGKVIDFVLSCLRHQYSANSTMEGLLKLYLSLKSSETAFNLIKLRAERKF